MTDHKPKTLEQLKAEMDAAEATWNAAAEAADAAAEADGIVRGGPVRRIVRDDETASAYHALFDAEDDARAAEDAYFDACDAYRAALRAQEKTDDEP